jgi:hypothetical protein
MSVGYPTARTYCGDSREAEMLLSEPCHVGPDKPQRRLGHVTGAWLAAPKSYFAPLGFYNVLEEDNIVFARFLPLKSATRCRKMRTCVRLPSLQLAAIELHILGTKSLNA